MWEKTKSSTGNDSFYKTLETLMVPPNSLGWLFSMLTSSNWRKCDSNTSKNVPNQIIQLKREYLYMSSKSCTFTNWLFNLGESFFRLSQTVFLICPKDRRLPLHVPANVQRHACFTVTFTLVEQSRRISSSPRDVISSVVGLACALPCLPACLPWSWTRRRASGRQSSWWWKRKGKRSRRPPIQKKKVRTESGERRVRCASKGISLVVF